MSLRPTLPTEQVPGQPGLHRETLSQKIKHNKPPPTTATTKKAARKLDSKKIASKNQKHNAEIDVWGWKDVSVVKNAHSPCRRHKFSSQHIMAAHYSPYLQFQRMQCPPLAPLRHLHSCAQTPK